MLNSAASTSVYEFDITSRRVIFWNFSRFEFCGKIFGIFHSSHNIDLCYITWYKYTSLKSQNLMKDILLWAHSIWDYLKKNQRVMIKNACISLLWYLFYSYLMMAVYARIKLLHSPRYFLELLTNLTIQILSNFITRFSSHLPECLLQFSILLSNPLQLNIESPCCFASTIIAAAKGLL